MLPALVGILTSLEISYLTPSRYCHQSWCDGACVTLYCGGQVPCDDSTLKKMEFEFHSASYLTLLEAVQAMKNVLGHLISYKVCMGDCVNLCN